MKQLLFSTLGSVRSINIIYTVSTISHQQLSTSKEFCFRCIKMTPGIQTTLCYIRERWIIQTPTSPSFLITEYPRAGSNFLTFTYYLKISKTSGDSVMLFFFSFLLLNGLVAVRSLQCIWYMISALARQARGTKLILFATGGALRPCQHGYRCVWCAVLGFIYWEGTRDMCFPETSILVGPLGWECSECSTAKQHTVTRGWIICKDFCSSCLAPDCIKFIFKIT